MKSVFSLWNAWDSETATRNDAPSWANSDSHLQIQDDFYDIEVSRLLPQVPGGRPVTIQAGDSAEGHEFAVRNANVIFSAYPEINDALTFANDIRPARVRQAAPRMT